MGAPERAGSRGAFAHKRLWRHGDQGMSAGHGRPYCY